MYYASAAFAQGKDAWLPQDESAAVVVSPIEIY
jgi:hypothetical protein